MERITFVKPLPHYKLHLRFTDGTEGMVDLSNLVGIGVFTQWENEAFFNKVTIDQETHTICWPGGIDLCPDSLYQEITKNLLVTK
ncbi:MAG: DUF2442 domain-containing protein [bacterium]